MKLRNSLSVRVILIVFAVLLGIFLITTLITTAQQNRSILERNLQESEILSNLILSGIRYPMVTGDQDIIQSQFDNYAGFSLINVISLLDHRGVIRRSTDRHIIGLMSMAEDLDRALNGENVRKIEKRKRDGKYIFPVLSLSQMNPSAIPATVLKKRYWGYCA